MSGLHRSGYQTVSDFKDWLVIAAKDGHIEQHFD